MRRHLDGCIQGAMGFLQFCHQCHHRRVRSVHPHPPAYRHHVKYVDDKRRRAHTDILWCADNVARILPALRLHHCGYHLCHDGHIVDYHRHHRHRPAGYRCCPRHSCAIHRRSHHFRSIFRRQDVTHVRHHRACLHHGKGRPLLPHPLYDVHHGAQHHADPHHLSRYGILV